jgi:competence ComEA-like helix-hairpin-helix protein
MWKDYYSFNKRQRKGILVLLFLIVLMLGSLIILNHLSADGPKIDFSAFKKEINKARHDSVDHNVTTTEAANKDTSSVNKVNVNAATIKELSRQPGINYYLAKAIVNYREEHGPYKELKDLLNNAAIDKQTFSQISPYLTVTQ